MDIILKKLGFTETYTTYQLSELDGGGTLVIASGAPHELIQELVRKGILRTLTPSEQAEVMAKISRATLINTSSKRPDLPSTQIPIRHQFGSASYELTPSVAMQLKPKSLGHGSKAEDKNEEDDVSQDQSYKSPRF